MKIKLPDGETVSAKLFPAEKRRGITYVFAHGAGAGHSHPFMTRVASLFAERGVSVLTFNFLYMEKIRKYPDKKDLLEDTYRRAIEFAANETGDKRIFIGGKSMGGRIATQVAAAEFTESKSLNVTINGIVVFGYPLHPPGKPGELRTAHFPNLKTPWFICQGSRDAFGSGKEIIRETKKMNVIVHEVQNGDHSLKVSGITKSEQDEVLPKLIDTVVPWMVGIQ